MDGIAIRRLPALGGGHLDELAAVPVDCVDGGASVSFLPPLDLPAARDYWSRVGRDVAGGGVALLVAEDADGVAGTVHLVLARQPNAAHRAEVAKLLVHRRARRRGLGAALMSAAEDVARDCDRTLLVLDTTEGGDAERLYERLGWRRVGVIPDFAAGPDGALVPTTYSYKRLGDAG